MPEKAPRNLAVLLLAGATPCRLLSSHRSNGLPWARPFWQRDFPEKGAATIKDKYDQFLRPEELDYAFASSLSKLHALSGGIHENDTYSWTDRTRAIEPFLELRAADAGPRRRRKA
jgi:hypothetical protein